MEDRDGRSEPDVISGIAIVFDKPGRMFVAEDRGYRAGSGREILPVGGEVKYAAILVK